jgi:hypothetical protein
MNILLNGNSLSIPDESRQEYPFSPSPVQEASLFKVKDTLGFITYRINDKWYHRAYYVHIEKEGFKITYSRELSGKYPQ